MKQLRNLRTSLLDKVGYPLLVALMTPFAFSVISKARTRGWSKWYTYIPMSWWMVLALGVPGLIVFAITRKRRKRLEELNAGPPIRIVSMPLFGWVTIGRLTYADVVWLVRAHAPNPIADLDRREQVDACTIEVETPPRCPDCETEIEESHSFWGGYVWKCVGCGFKKRSRDSYYDEEERAEKIARRQFEKKCVDQESGEY